MKKVLTFLKGHKAFTVYAFFVLLILLVAVFAKQLAPYSPTVSVLRDAFQVPLWLMGNVYVLGTVTLVLGVPLFALVCWASYLIIAGPRREHKARMQAQQQAAAEGAAGDATQDAAVDE